MSIKERLLQKKNLWHVGAVALFLVISCIYFSPALKGYVVDQGDVRNWLGMSQEIMDYRETDGEQVLWTNSMFSGMPSTQISMSYEGQQVQHFFRSLLTLWLPTPVSLLFLYFLGFYVLAISFRMKPIIGIIGALAYGFSSYFIIIIEAGHNTKGFALAFAPFVVAGFIYAFKRKNWILGVGLSALFMMLEIGSNHLQITYYLAYVLLAFGIVLLIEAIQKSEIKKFLMRAAGVILAYGLAVLVNIGNIWGTLEYTEHTTRGPSELTINADGTPKEEKTTSGLDKDYITGWSYGKSETFTLLVPNFKGGETQAIGQNEDLDRHVDKAENQFKQQINQSNQYWGNQPFTSGPVYIGAIIFLLAFLGLVYSKKKIKWALFAVTILAIALSWGKNFMGLTDFFIDVVPGYGKFRTVSMILVIAQLCLPILAMLFLHQLFQAREEIAKNIKPFFIVTGTTVGLLLIFLAIPEATNTFLSEAEQDQLASYTNPQQVEYVNTLFVELEKVRISIFRADVLRSLFFVILGGGLVLLYIKRKTNWLIPGVGLAFLVLIDLMLVDMRYLNNEEGRIKDYKQWVDRVKRTYPYVAGDAENTILSMELQTNPELKATIDSARNEAIKYVSETDMDGGQKQRYIDWKIFRTLNRNTNFRVLDFGNPFNSSRASYFLKSAGGYHGAKLGRYQDMIEFHLSKQNQAVLNMLNIKYFVQSRGQNSQLTGVNASASGNAWMVEQVNYVSSPDEEITSLNSYKSAVLDPTSVTPILINGKKVESPTEVDGSERIQYVNIGVSKELELKLDTMDISLPLQQMQDGDKLSLVKNDSTGLNWAYAANVDTSIFNQVFTLELKGISGFDPEKMVVTTEKFKNVFSSESYSGEGTVELKSYHPEKLVYDFSSPEKQLVVFSEVYYPIGWKAFVDDKEVDIARVNYILRAIEVPAGEHEIRFEFDLPSYHKSATLAWSASIVVLLLLAFGFYKQVKNLKELPSEVVSEDDNDETSDEDVE